MEQEEAKEVLGDEYKDYNMVSMGITNLKRSSISTALLGIECRWFRAINPSLLALLFGN